MMALGTWTAFVSGVFIGIVFTLGAVWAVFKWAASERAMFAEMEDQAKAIGKDWRFKP